MGFDDAANRLRTSAGEAQRRTVPVITLAGHKYAVSIASIAPRLPDLSGREFWDDFRDWPFGPFGWFRDGICVELIGLDLNILRILGAAISSSKTSDLMELEPVEPRDAPRDRDGGAFYGSVFSDGSIVWRIEVFTLKQTVPRFRMDRGGIVTTYKKKLIEVAIPLEAINAASAREKSIRHGHPSTLHLWWARRPLAACRAVLFAQLVDDPSGYSDKLLDDPKIRKQAEADLLVRLKAWRDRKADAQGNVPDTPEPTLEDCGADIERKRLFEIIEELVLWENSTNEEVLERGRAEIRRSCGGVLPPVYDPFSGGGSIPLEAQRLGLPAYGSDLNPVAVMIGKAMIEIPPKFKDMPPIHPGIKDRSFYRNAEGLAEDVKYYGEWMREKALERIGHLYPQVDLPKEYGGGKATVIAWIWARTVPSPDPAFRGCAGTNRVELPAYANEGQRGLDRASCQ